MKKWFLVIDVEKCENCNNCMLACKDEHVGNEWKGYSAPQPDHGHKWMQIFKNERGQYPLIDVAYLPVPCMHCDNAPCIRASKEGAVYKREDGIVIIDPVKASGQRHIVEACPYHAIGWNEEISIPQKCTLCAHLLDDGWNKPRCVQACPTGALSIKKVTEGEMQSIIQKENLEIYQPQFKTSPRVYYKNLYRFTKCFIAGSVSFISDNREDCAEGAAVTLYDISGKKIAEAVTDNYGDYKFDGLEENSDRYTVKIAYKDYENRIIEAEVKKSVNLGVIRF